MKVFIALILLTFTSASFATAIDLSSWTDDTYDLSGGQSAGNWVLSNNDETVTQTVNADPSVYLNNLNQTSYSIDGTWEVKTASDDDFMGFVFGYQDDSHYYVMDWKQSTQNAGTAYGTATEGFRILEINADSRTDLVLKDYWESSTSNSEVLASKSSSTYGWSDNTSYTFHLDFNTTTTAGDIHISVKDGPTTLWDVLINDLTYTSGQFGFYNFSQSTVEYSGFEQTGGVIVNPVPIPAAVWLFGSGLMGLIGINRKKVKRATIPA